MRTVYISGPMAGHPHLNEPAFRAAEHTTWGAGAEPLTPHDLLPHAHPGRCAPVYGDGRPGDHDGGCYLRGDLAAMLDKATSLYVLPGWSQSRGAGYPTTRSDQGSLLIAGAQRTVAPIGIIWLRVYRKGRGTRDYKHAFSSSKGQTPDPIRRE